MLIGYVSDERFVAIPGALLEFENEHIAVEARSRASGAVHAELPPGQYVVTVAREGYGSKRAQLTVKEGALHHFRLLKDGLLGYAWPKWVRAGERSEFRVHSDEAYKISLWRYGWNKELVRPLGWFDEHGPRATVQITPDGDYSQSGVQWNKFGYTRPHHKQYVEAPQRSGLYYFHANTESGKRMIGVSDGFDSDVTMSKMQLAMFAALQEMFIDQLRSGVVRGMDDAFRQGTNTGLPC